MEIIGGELASNFRVEGLRRGGGGALALVLGIPTAK